MKTKKTVLKFISKILLQRVVVFIILLSLPFLSFGQLVNETKLFSFENNFAGGYELRSFVCRYVEQKVYIMWTVLEPSDECVYRLERSTDDKTYNTVYAIKGAKSPRNNELLNSFIDEEPLKGISYYRVRRFTKEESMVSSSFIVNEPKMPVGLQFKSISKN